MRQGRARRVWRWQTLVLIAALGIALVALHQMSLNHAVAEPHLAGHSAHIGSPAIISVTSGSASSAFSSDARGGAGHSAGSPDAWPGAPASAGAVWTAPDGTAGTMPADGLGDCPGCGTHGAIALTCLAVIILLGLAWRAARPDLWRNTWPLWRLREPSPVPRPAFGSLSLAELSISRT